MNEQGEQQTEATAATEIKEARRGNRLARAGLFLTVALFMVPWMFKVERNTARTATAIEFIVDRLPVLESEVSKNRDEIFLVKEQSNKNAIRNDEQDKRLDDHQRLFEIINAIKGAPQK